MPARRRSRLARLIGVLPRTNALLDALSATVSTKRMFQLAMRLPTISMAGSAKPTARISSEATMPASGKSRSITSATSASTLGCINRDQGTGSLSAKAMSENSMPKSG